jgi:hypothetical protein
MLALGQRQRGQQAGARYLERVAEGPEETLRALAGPICMLQQLQRWRLTAAHNL